jgi:hypothetical protein
MAFPELRADRLYHQPGEALREKGTVARKCQTLHEKAKRSALILASNFFRSQYQVAASAAIP